MLRLLQRSLRLSRPSSVSARLTVSTSRSLSTSMATSEASVAVANPTVYCRDYVRARDYESYLIGGFYPRHLQGAFFALRAFYVSWIVDVSLHYGCMLSYECLQALHHFMSATDRVGVSLLECHALYFREKVYIPFPPE